MLSKLRLNYEHSLCLLLDKDFKTIIQNENSQSGPRMPAHIPIYCEYENGVLYFGFSYDLGAVTVTVTNEDTNQQWQAVLQTSSGYNSMNISEDTGCYHIEITTINNVVYQGNFEI